VLYSTDMQKFPLRLKDNDLLITDLYRDPSGQAITALSVYLTTKNSEFFQSDPVISAGYYFDLF